MGPRPFSNDHLDDDGWCHHATLYHPRQATTTAPFAASDLEAAADLVPVSRVTTSLVDVLVVEVVLPGNRRFAAQAGGRLHITLGCAPEVRPVSANEALQLAGVDPVGLPTLRGRVTAVIADRALRYLTPR